jgi:hypothetical protein
MCWLHDFETCSLTSTEECTFRTWEINVFRQYVFLPKRDKVKKTGENRRIRSSALQLWWLIHTRPGLTLKKLIFCPHTHTNTAVIYFVRFSQYTAVVFLYISHRLVFLIENYCVLSDVRNEPLYVIQMNLRLQRIKRFLKNTCIVFGKIRPTA